MRLIPNEWRMGFCVMYFVFVFFFYFVYGQNTPELFLTIFLQSISIFKSHESSNYRELSQRMFAIVKNGDVFLFLFLALFLFL